MNYDSLSERELYKQRERQDPMYLTKSIYETPLNASANPGGNSAAQLGVSLQSRMRYDAMLEAKKNQDEEYVREADRMARRRKDDDFLRQEVNNEEAMKRMATEERDHAEATRKRQAMEERQRLARAQEAAKQPNAEQLGIRDRKSSLGQ